MVCPFCCRMTESSCVALVSGSFPCCHGSCRARWGGAVDIDIITGIIRTVHWFVYDLPRGFLLHWFLNSPVKLACGSRKSTSALDQPYMYNTGPRRVPRASFTSAPGWWGGRSYFGFHSLRVAGTLPANALCETGGCCAGLGS